MPSDSRRVGMINTRRRVRSGGCLPRLQKTCYVNLKDENPQLREVRQFKVQKNNGTQLFQLLARGQIHGALKKD